MTPQSLNPVYASLISLRDDMGLSVIPFETMRVPGILINTGTHKVLEEAWPVHYFNNIAHLYHAASC